MAGNKHSGTSENDFYTLKCVLHGHINSARETTTYCTQCGSVLEIEYHENHPSKKQIRYPVTSEVLIPDPLRTYHTELKFLSRLSEKYQGNIWAKCEFQNPTGCFKDRGSYVEVMKAMELEANAICLASTGNMAASVAAYSSYFGIKCYVFVPESTTEAKLAQVMVYNAKIVKVKGDFTVCESLCRQFAKSGNYYLAGDYVFREEGQKSLSYEVVEQGGEDIEYVLVPVGCGTNFSAIWKGFYEAYEQGLTKRLPKMIAIQPEGSSPVVKGIAKRSKVIEDRVQTIAGAVAAADPIDFYKVLKGVEKSNGFALTVTEEEILDALTEMAQTEGLFTEPAGALGLAAYKRYRDRFGDAKCMFVLTGSGLKDTGVVVRHSLPSPVIANDLGAIYKFINSGYLDIQANAWGKSQQSPFENLKLEPEQAKIFNDYIERFNKRGKALTEKELEVLQSMVFDDIPESEQFVQVLDYDVRMRKNGLVKASVSLEINGETIDAKAKGVGPLDAAFLAVKSVTDSYFPVEVADHNVEVLSPAASALVVVTLRLKSNQHQFLVKSVSTDTLEAGLKAFVKGLALAKQKSEAPQE